MCSSDTLIDQIDDVHLKASIQMIKLAALRIWAADAPRIVQYFTDHGPDHSERVSKYVCHILEANGGQHLSSEEIYLLLTGLYLHDIGMQWDIRCFPDIKRRAENLGAQFNSTLLITLRDGGDLTSEFQEAVRRNHHYLSAAWIEYARETGDSALGNAALSIPEELVSDLMCVCKFHSQISIDICHEISEINPGLRLKLVAAILRLADELDVGKTRISLESIKNFEFPIEHSIYWWLHHQTNVSIENKNSILLTVRLHPDDSHLFGSDIYNLIIKKFIDKNQYLINYLVNNSFNIKISDRSKIVVDKFIGKIPKEVISAIDSMKSPLFLLSKELSILLRAIRYEVGDPHLRTPYVDTIAVLDKGTAKQRVLIRCIEGPITERHVLELEPLLDRITNQGLLITQQDVAEQAKEVAARIGGIEAFSLSDFIKDKIWGPYFKVLKMGDFNEISRDYVDLACYRLERSPSAGSLYLDRIKSDGFISDEGSSPGFKKMNFPSLDRYVDRWLNDPTRKHISLLGEFGSGKTWFCRHYAYRQLERYLNDPLNERMPLLITLRDFTKTLTVQLLINDAMLSKYKLPFVGDAFEIIQELNHRGKLLLILDGFDEMARQVNFQKIVDNFWELAKLVDANSKVILTSRREFFREDKDAVSVLQGDEFGTFIDKLPAPKFDVLYQEPFNDQQIKAVIAKRIIPEKGSEKGLETANRILGIPNLAELARKPVVLRYLLAALDEVGGDVLEKPAQVYLYATNQLIFRNIKDLRTFLKMENFLLFGCELAWEMIKSGEMHVHFKDFPERIKKHFRIKDPEIDYWAYDLRDQSLLHRDPEGNYEFAHKSIAEYFAAFKFTAELGCLAPEFSKTYLEINKEPCIIPYSQKDISELADTFGKLSLRTSRMRAVRQFMVGMMAEDAPGRLWRIIDETKGQPASDIGFCGGNAAILLQNLGSRRPHPYEDIIDLLEVMQRSPESVFPPRPATTRMMNKELEKIRELTVYQKAEEIYNISQDENRLKEASELAEILRDFPGCRDFCLSVQAYAGLQSLYKNRFEEAEGYFRKYLDLGGYALWYNLKMGLVRLHQGRMDESRAMANDVLSGSLGIDKKMEGRAFLLLGILDRMDRIYTDAINKFDQACSTFIQAGDRYHEGTTLANIGIAYRMDGQFDKALENYDKSFKIFLELNDVYRQGCVQARRGTIYRLMNKFDESIEDYKEAIKIFDRVADDLRKGIVLRELGTTYLITGHWNDAIKSYNQALDIFRDPKVSKNPEAPLRTGLTLYSLGLAYLMQGKWDQAIEEFKVAIDLSRNRGASWNLSLALSGIGSAYRMKDEHHKALPPLTEALEIVRILGNARRVALILTKLGAVYRGLHQYEKAIECFQEALDITHSLGDLSRLGKINGSLGTVYRRMGDIEKAQMYYEDARKIFTDIGDRVKISWILEELGQVYIMQGFSDKALAAYKESLNTLLRTRGVQVEESSLLDTVESGGASAIKDRTHGALVDDSLVNLAEGYILQGIHKGGIHTYKAALDEVQRLGDFSLEAKIEQGLGEAYRRMGDYESALIHLDRSLKIYRSINDRDQIAKTLCYQGMVYSITGPYSESIKRTQESIDIFSDLGDSFLGCWAMEHQGIIHMMQRHWEEAIDIFSKAVELNLKSEFSHFSLALCYKKQNLQTNFNNECRLSRELSSLKKLKDYDLARLEAVCISEESTDVRRNSIFKICQLIKNALESGMVHVSIVRKDPLLQSIRNSYCFQDLVGDDEIQQITIVPFM